MTDLNERVEARIEEYALDVQGSQSNEGATILRLVESWRERWDRHRPCPDVYTCQTCMPPINRPDGYPNDDWTSEMCADGRAVLREIGISL